MRDPTFINFVLHYEINRVEPVDPCVVLYLHWEISTHYYYDADAEAKLIANNVEVHYRE